MDVCMTQGNLTAQDQHDCMVLVSHSCFVVSKSEVGKMYISGFSEVNYY